MALQIGSIRPPSAPVTSTVYLYSVCTVLCVASNERGDNNCKPSNRVRQHLKESGTLCVCVCCVSVYV